MKYLVFLFFFSVLFISCKSDNPVSVDSFTTVGKLTKIGTSTWMYGTHIIKDSNGNIPYALESSSINLDHYNNKLVGIVGVDIGGGADGGPTLLEVKKVVVLE